MELNVLQIFLVAHVSRLYYFDKFAFILFYFVLLAVQNSKSLELAIFSLNEQFRKIQNRLLFLFHRLKHISKIAIGFFNVLFIFLFLFYFLALFVDIHFHPYPPASLTQILIKRHAVDMILIVTILACGFPPILSHIFVAYFALLGGSFPKKTVIAVEFSIYEFHGLFVATFMIVILTGLACFHASKPIKFVTDFAESKNLLSFLLESVDIRYFIVFQEKMEALQSH